MKKALAALRRNGVEVLAILQHVCCQLFTLSTQVATLYDQNHIDNHKNSMVGQCVLMELQQGDRVQVLYYYTALLHYCISVLLYFCSVVLLYFCIVFIYFCMVVFRNIFRFSAFRNFCNDGDYPKFHHHLVQVYLYTFTGLHDKAGNHLTQFMGVLLK